MARSAKRSAGAGPGYSGTPLAQKLGIRGGMALVVRRAPADYRRWLEPLPAGVTFNARAGRATAMAHVFVTARADLDADLRTLRSTLTSEATVWVSWPKKSSGVASEVTEDTVRELALPLGFVDVKVCAVSEVWSGLKLVVRKTLR